MEDKGIINFTVECLYIDDAGKRFDFTLHPANVANVTSVSLGQSDVRDVCVDSSLRPALRAIQALIASRLRVEAGLRPSKDADIRVKVGLSDELTRMLSDYLCEVMEDY